MKIEIRKIEGYYEDDYDYVEQEWDWMLRADNGAPIAESMFSYVARTDAIHGALLTTGLYLPTRPKGVRTTMRAAQTQRRGGSATVYVSYGAGGMVKLAQWQCSGGEFVELVEA